MGTRINFANLELNELDAECIALITMFARELEKHNGVLIRLTDKHVLREVIRHAHSSSNQKLQLIYKRLKVAIKNFINSDGFDLSAHEKQLISDNAKPNTALDTLDSVDRKGRRL